MIRRAASVLAIVLAAGGANASAANLARDAAQHLDQAAKALVEADGARDRILALTETVRGYEKGLAALRESLRLAVLEERAMREDFSIKAEELSRLLATIQAIERSGTEASLLHPEGPLPAIRAGMLTADLVPALAVRAEALSEELADLTAVVSLQTSAKAQLELGLSGIRAARLELAQAISNRTGLPEPVATDEAALQALVNSAETLSGFAASLMSEEARNAPPLEGWQLPVIGNRLRGFDEPDADGIARPGWTIAAEPGALVTAPVSGTVRFTGSLLDQGTVVILEPRAGELLILAGLGEALATRGEIVSKGAPLGQMRGPDAVEQQNLNETARDGGQRRSETLYIEVRQGGDAVDPRSRFDGSVE